MAFQSVWYYTDLPEDIVDIIERDLTENFDPQMADSRLHGDALNKDKRNHRTLGYLLHIGLLVSYGIMFNVLTVRISCMI